MKKTLFLIFLFLVLLFPIHVNAVTVREAKITGSKEKKIGEEGEITVSISFDEFKKGWYESLGIWMVAFTIEVDEDVIVLTDVSSNDFDGVLTYDSDDKSYYILSEVSEQASNNKLCAEGELYCSDYSIKIKYVVKNTTKSSGYIDIKESGAIFLDMTEDREYTLNDGIELEFPKMAKHVISIKKQSSNNNKPSISNISTTPTKSENKSLKSLEIEGVEFEFDKQKTDYTISVDPGVNKLNIKATPDDKNATYKVIGADNLSASKNIVRVEVTAQDKTKQTYYIRVRYDKDNKNELDTVKENHKEKENQSKKGKLEVNDDLLKWIAIGVGAFVGIGIISFIISKIKDRSIDKKLDSLDDD